MKERLPTRRTNRIITATTMTSIMVSIITATRIGMDIITTGTNPNGTKATSISDGTVFGSHGDN